MTTEAPGLSLIEAEVRVLGIQTKLHHWAVDDGGRRFDDLFNLVCDPAFLMVGWAAPPEPTRHPSTPQSASFTQHRQQHPRQMGDTP